MFRQIAKSDEARARLKAGIDEVADTVKVTLGPKGKNVVLAPHQNPLMAPIITNDGVTIAREIVLEDRFANAGANLIKEVASRTNDTAGDGTTTAAVLMQAIINEGLKAIAAGADAVAVRRGIEQASKAVVEQVKKEAVKSDDLETLISTATISCGDAELGKLVATVVKDAGSEGMVALEENNSPETVSEKLEGLKLRGGFQLPLFVTVPEAQQAIFNHVPIVVTNQSVTFAQEIARIYEAASQTGKKEVVLIANSIDSDAMLTIIKNWVEGRFKILPLRVMSHGESGEGMLRDVASITGATFIDQLEGKKISDLTPADLGEAEKIVATKGETTIMATDEQAKKDRIKELKALSAEPSTKEFERESIKERIAKLSSAMFTIKVGGTVETEMRERKLRVEDAINATKAALSDGVVAGGGSALWRAGASISGGPFTDDELAGWTSLRRACNIPFDQMRANSSIGEYSPKALTDKEKSVDFTTGETVNAFEKGIIDPVKVVVEAVQNAASGAAMFLTTEAAVVDKDEAQAETI